MLNISKMTFKSNLCLYLFQNITKEEEKTY